MDDDYVARVLNAPGNNTALRDSVVGKLLANPVRRNSWTCLASENQHPADAFRQNLPTMRSFAAVKES
ncbi:MAG: hypothetical protein ACK5JI_10780 [Azonexus sp.]